MALGDNISLSGTKVFVSATRAPTHTQTDFEAVSGFVEVKGVISADLPKESANFQEVALLNGTTLPYLGARSLTEQAVTMLWDNDDAGQGVIRANDNTDVPISFKFELPSGDIVYASGLIGGAALPSGGDASAMRQSEFNVRSVYDSAQIGAIYVPA